MYLVQVISMLQNNTYKNKEQIILLLPKDNIILQYWFKIHANFLHQNKKITLVENIRIGKTKLGTGWPTNAHPGRPR